MYFAVLIHKLARNEKNLMKLILSLYDRGIIMHEKFHEAVIGCREVIAL